MSPNIIIIIKLLQQQTWMYGMVNLKVSPLGFIIRRRRPSPTRSSEWLSGRLTKSVEVLDSGHTIRFPFLEDNNLVSELCRRWTSVFSRWWWWWWSLFWSLSLRRVGSPCSNAVTKWRLSSWSASGKQAFKAPPRNRRHHAADVRARQWARKVATPAEALHHYLPTLFWR